MAYECSPSKQYIEAGVSVHKVWTIYSYLLRR